MTRQVLIRARAEADLIDIALYVAEHNHAAAERFLTAAERACAQLATFPHIGSPRTPIDPSFAGLRVWPIPGFESYSIYYIPRASHVDVLRVLHGARDSARLFE